MASRRDSRLAYPLSVADIHVNDWLINSYTNDPVFHLEGSRPQNQGGAINAQQSFSNRPRNAIETDYSLESFLASYKTQLEARIAGTLNNSASGPTKRLKVSKADSSPVQGSTLEAVGIGSGSHDSSRSHKTQPIDDRSTPAQLLAGTLEDEFARSMSPPVIPCLFIVLMCFYRVPIF